MKKEIDLGVRYVRAYEREEVPGQCHVIQMPDGWVSDALKGEMGKWCPTQAVMIAAPTGSGKTTFVADICKHCRRYFPKKKVLLLENRVAIATQQKKELAKSLRSAWSQVQDIHALELVDELKDVDLTIITYQKFGAQYAAMDLKQFAFVVLDEAHYFLSDAVFNASLDNLLSKLPKLFSHAVRLYLTATPGAVLADICNAEMGNIRCCGCCNYPFNCAGKGKLLMYNFPNHFGRVQLFYFHGREEIASIAQAHPDEKMLVFTAARENHDTSDAKSYCKILEGKGVNVSYLDRFTKDSDIWREVCYSSDFEAQALVCTSVLDCGVSFHNTKLRHIVVETTDKTEFLQMIGRRRLEASETINVYLRVPKKAAVISRLKSVNSSLSVIYEGFQAANIHEYDRLISRGWVDESPEKPYMHLLNYIGNGKVFPKMTAYHFLRWQKATLERLLQNMDTDEGDSALPRMAHEWLEQPNSYDPTHWLDYDKKAQADAQLHALLESYAEKTIGQKEFSAFLKEAFLHIGVLCKSQHDNERELKHTALNNRLKTLGFPYEIRKTKAGYRLKYKEDGNHGD